MNALKAANPATLQASTRPGSSATGWISGRLPSGTGASTSSGSASGDTTLDGAKQRNDGATDGEQRGIGERPGEVVATEQPLAEDRPDAEPAEHGDREVTRSLGSTIARRQVGDQGGRADEDSGFADAHQPAQREELRE